MDSHARRSTPLVMPSAGEGTFGWTNNSWSDAEGAMQLGVGKGATSSSSLSVMSDAVGRETVPPIQSSFIMIPPRPPFASRQSDGNSVESAQTTISGMPSNASTARRPARRTSTQLLQSKLPMFLRGNLPSMTERRQSAPPLGDKEATAGYHLSLAKRILRRRLAVKNMVIATLAEFVGTFLFLFFALSIGATCGAAVKARQEQTGGQADVTLNLIALLVSSLGAGFALCISAWCFFRVSGGVQNPAITLALTLTGALSWPKCVCLSAAQYTGGIAAASLLAALYPHHAADVRITLASHANVTIVQAFCLEFVMAAQLTFTVLMLAAEKHKATFLAPVGIGLALFMCQLLGQPYTGAAINPARTLGPDVAMRMFDAQCWLYYCSSYLAAIVTAGFFLLLKWLHYQSAAPDQDAHEDQSAAPIQLLLDRKGNVIGMLNSVPAADFDALDEEEEEHFEGQSDVPPVYNGGGKEGHRVLFDANLDAGQPPITFNHAPSYIAMKHETPTFAVCT